MKTMDIDDYYSVVKENKFYNRAISRTNLNCKILMKRIGEIPRDKYHMGGELSNCFRYIIWNHIMQAYHNDYGIDIIPESCGDMYGYFVRIIHRKDNELLRVADLTSGSLRIDAASDYFEILDVLFEEKDLYITILKSMKHFYEKVIVGEIKDNCINYKNKNLFMNNEIYLSLYQVLTMASCMGLIESWILGMDYIPEYFKTMDRESNLGYLGYFKLNLTISKSFFINKISGDIFYLGKKLIEYKQWCNDDIGQGIKTIMKLNESEEQPLLFTAFVGGFLGDSFSVEINFIQNICNYTTFDSQFSNEKTEKRVFNKKNLDRFISTMLKIVPNWDESYEPEDIILDGTNWSVNLLTNRNVFASSGSNAYPEEWQKFCRIISRTIGYFG